MTGDGFGYSSLGAGADPEVAGSTRNPPPGWNYEPADWDVGITTDGWYHEGCPLWVDYEPLQPFPQVTRTELGPADVEQPSRVYLSRLECPCGAKVVVATLA